MLKNKKTIIAIFSIIFFEILIYIIEPIIKKNIKVITIIATVFLCISYIMYTTIKKKKYSTKHIIFLIILIGILLRSMYIVYTPITERQHDVYGIGDMGHLDYIYTIYETNDLPNTNNGQFYHPPLFHIIAAEWLKVNEILNVPMERSLEGIQVITVIFSSIILIATHKITDELNIKEIYKLLINAFMAFYPTFILLSGSINNDVLTILLQFCILIYLIKWNKDDSIKNTLILAIFTGLCVMTKISGAIMAIPILFVFIEKFVNILKNDRKKLLKIILKFAIFAFISLPIGLWHPIRNFLLFKQPIGGVALPAGVLYTGNYTSFQRFFSISFRQIFGELYCVIPGDYNVFAYIVKCSILGEFTYNNFSIIATIMKIINLLLIIASLLAIGVYFIKNRKNNFIEDLLLVTWVTNIISFYIFNLHYPYVCTMDFRYIVLTAFIGISVLLMELNSIKTDKIKNILEYLICIFISMCFAMFFVI